MKAIVQDRYGSADVLKLEDIEKPAVGKRRVTLRVGAASAFIGDWHMMAGTPYAIRLVSGLRAPKQRILGQDLAGTVEAVGEGVTGFRAGDEVFGAGAGAFAEYATARPDKLAPKPTNLSFEEAATVPSTGSTALQGLRNVGKVRAEQHVLVIGAAGGVGSFALQIGKAFGAQVTGCMQHFEGRARPLDRRRRGDRRHPRGHRRDSSLRVIFDTAGNREVSDLRRILTPKGTLVLAGGEGSGRWLGMGRAVKAKAISPFVGQRMTNFLGRTKTEDLLVLKDLIEAGKVKPVIGAKYPLSHVPKAIGEFGTGRGRGKVVITL